MIVAMHSAEEEVDPHTTFVKTQTTFVETPTALLLHRTCLLWATFSVSPLQTELWRQSCNRQQYTAAQLPLSIHLNGVMTHKRHIVIDTRPRQSAQDCCVQKKKAFFIFYFILQKLFVFKKNYIFYKRFASACRALQKARRF